MGRIVIRPIEKAMRFDKKRQEKRDMATGNHWTIFNGGGAVERDNCSLEDVRDYLTPERFKRGWSAIYCVIVRAQEQLDEAASWQRVPVDAPAALAPLLTGYSLADTGLSKHDREAIEGQLRARWAALLAEAVKAAA